MNKYLYDVIRALVFVFEKAHHIGAVGHKDSHPTRSVRWKFRVEKVRATTHVD